MGSLLSKLVLVPILRVLHWGLSTFLPPWHTWKAEIFGFPLGLIPLVIHRALLQRTNLLPAPLPPPLKEPGPDLKYRPADGRGVDRKNPEAGATGSPFGRNMRPTPLRKRQPELPRPMDVQTVAQKLLARDSFKPAAMQLNVAAAAWVQAMVHDWVGHYDDKSDGAGVTLDKGWGPSGCPLKSFSFRRTLKRKDDDEFDSFRSNWWDASFLYGQEEDAVKRARTGKDGMLKVNTEHPNTLPFNGDYATTGDVKNSWVGVSLLQELFLREHNAIAAEIAKNHEDLAGDDEELFRRARLVVSAIVAKIHTVDWTCELLKTYTMYIGLNINWYGIGETLDWSWWPKFLDMGLTGNDGTENYGVPFCLTEDFVAVYRLHPLIPDGLYVGPEGDWWEKDYLPLGDLVGQWGEKTLRSSPDRPVQLWDSVLRYPCGNLVCHNYPEKLREVHPTKESGEPLPNRVDLAAIDLYRDRERGILNFNDFRRALKLKPYRDFDHLTGGQDQGLVKELEEIYGKRGIETCDLLVGSLAEKKIVDSKGSGGIFAISETSFILFLLMASRRLETDPFLNEKFTDEVYSSTGRKWVVETRGLRDVFLRHYPELMKDVPEGKSAFTPREAWPSQTSQML